ncbi:mannosyl-oligosaccharide glucosidase-like [Clarias gariepinus]|uniref:mannosyl-oligosaccharide glucosidase-like n=1 Tax=Clarias gariepinus TaxID=13013 RepID=UPI00234CAC2D|nr:mannosyl-oligosaccharide glucosidase-like [Clarias gariepinus]XP_053336328.1 mannosyl-oligosaccharide glucosidase-like [Clarias gariepinus]
MGRVRKRNVAADGDLHSQKEEKPPALVRREKEKKKGKTDISKILINISIGLCIFSLIWFFYAMFMRSVLARRPITLHPSPRVLDANSTSAAVSPERFWGSYRSQVYFGMKTRSPRSVVTGLMWMRQFSAKGVNLRHTCEQGDGLRSYGWLAHDGINFGMQQIQDNDFILSTTFVKRMGGEHGGDWTWRITGKQHSTAPQASVISLMFYVAADTQGSLQAHVLDRTHLSHVTGTSEELGNFRITFGKPTGGEESSNKYASYNYLQTRSPGLDQLTEIVKSSLSQRFLFSPSTAERKPYIAVDTYTPPPQQQNDNRIRSDFVVHQVTVQVPFQIEVLFESGSFHDRPNQLKGSVLTEEITRLKSSYNEKFEETFGLQAKGFTPAQVRFAKAALSNMLGGMGYFFGQSVVQSRYNEHPVLYPEGALFTAVPSRSFFPRGFLWDEGFHQLLISKWDPQVTREAVAHWLDLINVDGWIPREQILGDEALSKVPAEFVVQRTENANPPTFFLVLEEFMEQLEARPGAPHFQGTLNFLRRLYPRLQAWFGWYNTTQVGPLPNSYRWRGRDKDTNQFLNPKTLTSGLDDYPRASHPSEDERHVDLHCWMVLASRTMMSISRLLGEPHQEYERTYLALSDNNLLSELHWSEQHQAFCDYGNHTQAVSLQQEKIIVPPGQMRQQLPVKRWVRSLRKAPKLQYVNALGYVSLFPFLLHILTPDSQKLEYILKDIRDPARLWTPYGLRSLSRSDPIYMKRNTEHDAPYWRGAIWININYLALKALHHYSSIEGPYKEKAAGLYQELRTNVINNIYKQYQETGYIWEQYSDSTGRGQGSHPFTGWSALVVLIMAEEY